MLSIWRGTGTGMAEGRDVGNRLRATWGCMARVDMIQHRNHDGYCPTSWAGLGWAELS